MHFVAALDAVPEMRGVLALFEGVATGAADGYGRMADRPACTLLHLGPGLGNGLANLHNARRAQTPLVNIVGDHATYHKRFDAPLESDIEGVARNVSGWFRSSGSPDEVARDAADAVAASLGPPGQVATLVLPADVSWSEAGAPAAPVARHRGGTGRRRGGRLRGQGASGRRPHRAADRRPGAAARRPRGGGQGVSRHRGPSCWVRPSRPASNGARGCPRSSGWATWPSSPRPSSTA